MQGEQVGAGRPGGDPDGPPEQGLALGAAGQRDDDPLARLPRLVDAVRGAVALQPLVDPLGHPEQRQLAQRGEVADPEVVATARRPPGPSG